MFSSIAGSAAAIVLEIPLHNRSNVTCTNCESHRLTSVNSFEIVHEAAMSNDDENERQNRQLNAKVVINIRNVRYETYETTLLRYPNTLLGSASKRAPYFNHKSKQYCFNRNTEMFDAILYYFQSGGKLIMPDTLNEELFIEELEFFQIDPHNVAQLEYGSSNFRITKFKKCRHGRQSNPENSLTPYDIFLSWPCAIVVVLYMLTLCVSSSGQYQLVLPQSCGGKANNSRPTGTQLLETNDHPLVILHYVCSLWFFLEFILRFLRTELKVKYMKSVLGMTDMISVLSMFSQILLREFDVCQQGFLIYLGNVMRFLSILCMFKLTRYSTGLRLFGLTVKACSGQLILSLYCVGICLFFFSSVIYYSEVEEVNLDFTSIFDAFWYTIVTLTTVGYGDIVPTSTVGKLFGAICSVFGVTAVMAWPATIFVSYFQEMYNYEIGQKKKKARTFWSNKMLKFRKGLMRLDTTGCTFR